MTVWITGSKFMEWLRTHPFETHAIAFAMMIVPPLLVYLAMNNGADGLAGGLLGIIVLGNLLELVVG
jgi:hypothetical protein